jgi:hypothetical protein
MCAMCGECGHELNMGVPRRKLGERGLRACAAIDADDGGTKGGFEPVGGVLRSGCDLSSE